MPFRALSNFLLRRRVRRALRSRTHDALLESIDRDLADRESKVAALKREIRGGSVIALDELYREIRRLRRFRACVEESREPSD